MFKRLILSVISLVAVVAFTARPGVDGAAAPRLDSLAALFDPARGIVRDTNGDGLADTVAARVIVPAEPSGEDVEAAANIAARLSYETTAMTLPIVARDDQVTSPQGI